MISAAGAVLLPEALDRLGAEVALAPKKGRIKEVIRPGAERAADPRAKGDGETGLGAIDEGGGNAAIQELTQGPLSGGGLGGDLEGEGKAPGEGGHPVIEKGSAGFEAGGHGGPVNLHQDVGREVGEKIGEHEAGGRGREPKLEEPGGGW